jgi:hypothetical protein
MRPGHPDCFVGVGSFLFHTFANRWSLIADILPIAVVIYSFIFVALTRFLRLSLGVQASQLRRSSTFRPHFRL